MNKAPSPRQTAFIRQKAGRITPRPPASIVSLALKLGVAGAALPALFTAQAQPATSMAAASPANGQTVTTPVSITAREAFDSNVFMQSQGPLANRDSFVTIVIPSLGLKWKPCLEFWLDGAYTPEMASYSSDHSEDYVAHKAFLNLGGDAGKAKWEIDNSINWVEGNSKSPTYYWAGPTRPGITPVPALDGAPLRDRRDQMVVRENIKFEQPIGDWFVRPVATAFIQDFMTTQKTVTHVAGTTSYYADYVDRADFNAGLDAGYKIQENTGVFIGYRYGAIHQAQVAKTAVFPSFSNHYQRALAGIEGTPYRWLKLSAVVGPDFRSYYGAYIPTAFDKHRTDLYYDASASVTPTGADTIALAAKRFILCGYLGKSVLEDSTFELGWRHKFDDKLSAGLGFRLENWAFDFPLRNEWWYGGSVSVTCAFTRHLSGEASYNYDKAFSGDWGLGTGNWNAKRNLASLGVKYLF